MSRPLLLLPLLALAACEPQATAPMASAGSPPASAQGPLMHRVSVGGPDICAGLGLRPGCDGNLSLTALQFADGSIQGQAQDSRGGHLLIDCVEVLDNIAWLGGTDVAGNRWDLRVVDAGQTANDPPDSISFIIQEQIPVPGLCHSRPRGVLVRLTRAAPQGQVQVQ